LLRGIVLATPIAAAVATAALEAGFVINAPRPDVLRIAPPLIITDAQLDEFVAALPGLLKSGSETGEGAK
jgi:acetylornithine aminotransferase